MTMNPLILWKELPDLDKLVDNALLTLRSTDKPLLTPKKIQKRIEPRYEDLYGESVHVHNDHITEGQIKNGWTLRKIERYNADKKPHCAFLEFDHDDGRSLGLWFYQPNRGTLYLCGNIQDENLYKMDMKEGEAQPIVNSIVRYIILN